MQNEFSPLHLLAQAALMLDHVIKLDQENVPSNTLVSTPVSTPASTSTFNQPIKSTASKKKSCTRKTTTNDKKIKEFTLNGNLNHLSPSTSGYSSLATSASSSLGSSPAYEPESPNNLTKNFFEMEITNQQKKSPEISPKMIDLPAPEKPCQTRSLKRKSQTSNETLNLETDEDKVVIRTNDSKVCVLSSVIGKRKKPTKTPDEKKDEAYYERRARNNEAAKRSRELKNQTIKKVKKLASELDVKVPHQFESMGRELLLMNYVIVKMQENDEFAEAVMKKMSEHDLEEFEKAFQFFNEKGNLVAINSMID